MSHDQHTSRGREEAQIRTILVVEDDPGIGEALRSIILEETDYRFHLATKPSEALEVLEKVTPSLLLVDFHLPNIDGLELYDLLQILVGDPIPGIIISDEPSEYLKDGLRERKLLAVSKPFNVSDLLHTIDQAILSHATMEA